MKKIPGPKSEHDLHLSAPIDRWDEAIPLGNGLMGVLLWGQGRSIKLSLDRGDLWDVRTPEPFKSRDWTWDSIMNLVARKDLDALSKRFELPYSDFAYPSKIPAGRIELTFDQATRAEEFHLDLRRAVGHANLTSCKMKVFCSAMEPVGMIHIEGGEPVLKIIPPAFGQEVEMSHEGVSAGSLGRLGYPAPQHGRSGEICWTRQDCADGFQYAIVTATRKLADSMQIAFTVATNKGGGDPVAEGRQIVTRALAAGFEKTLRPHVGWWKKFWSQSAVTVPDKKVEQHYYLVQYFYGAASRRGAPPIPLQGVWTADEGTLPPWKGDYHNNLNTQLTYWPYLSADHLDEGLCFLDFQWNLLPEFQKFAKEFYHASGACVPGVMSLDGKAMGGWHQYSYSPTNGAWVAHAFYLHWRYTMDEKFLAERAYPFCREIAALLEGLLQVDQGGKLKLPLSSSPEIHDNTLEAWCTPNTNYDLSLMRWLFGALREMAGALEDRVSADKWNGILNMLDELAVADMNFLDVNFFSQPQLEMGGLKVSPDEPLKESHRHFSHLMAIHPLGILHVEGSDRDRAAIEDSIRCLDHLGMQFWCGYSFSWMACMAARICQPERALNMLELYLKGFISRNGFHLNGDFKGLGLAGAQYRPFTLEGNFAAAQAVHEMLLQSWGGLVRIFPAMPGAWEEAEFQSLRAEGAFRVSARREKGRTVWIRITAEAGAPLKLRDPFMGASIRWNRRDVNKVKDTYVCKLRAGESLEGEIESRAFLGIGSC